MIRTTSGRKSRLVVSQLWALGLHAVALLGWVAGVVPPQYAQIVHGVLGTIQAVSAIVLRQSTAEPMR